MMNIYYQGELLDQQQAISPQLQHVMLWELYDITLFLDFIGYAYITNHIEGDFLYIVWK